MKRPVEPQFGKALRAVRRASGLPQEAFDQVSSRTYVSALERGVKQPTLAKVAQLSAVMNVSPVALIALSFSAGSISEARKLLAVADEDLTELLRSEKHSGA